VQNNFHCFILNILKLCHRSIVCQCKLANRDNPDKKIRKDQQVGGPLKYAKESLVEYFFMFNNW